MRSQRAVPIGCAPAETSSPSWGGPMQRIARAPAIAILVSLSLPAAAQTATIYGRLYPELVWLRMTGATQPGESLSTLASPPTGESISSIARVDSSNSRMGFRGDEPLGGGVRAFFQIE